MILRKELFWEYDIEQLDLDKDYKIIIPRVAMSGKLDDIRFLIHYYTAKQLKETLLQTRYLDKYTLSLFSLLLDVPKEDFRCYKHAQSSPLSLNF